MTWESFYDNYLSWADSTIASRLSQISDLQNADPAEIVECCQCIDDKLAVRLLRKARAAGVSFTISQAIELWPCIDDFRDYKGGGRILFPGRTGGAERIRR